MWSCPPVAVSRGGALETCLLVMRKQAPGEGEGPGPGHTEGWPGRGEGRRETRTLVRRKFRGRMGRAVWVPASSRHSAASLGLAVTVRRRAVALEVALGLGGPPGVVAAACVGFCWLRGCQPLFRGGVWQLPHLCSLLGGAEAARGAQSRCLRLPGSPVPACCPLWGCGQCGRSLGGLSVGLCCL